MFQIQWICSQLWQTKKWIQEFRWRNRL